MKAVTKTTLYLSREEHEKIEVMVYDIDNLLIEMENQGLSKCNSDAYSHLTEAQNKLVQFLDEVKELEE